jgi:hypothetical protein
MTAECVAQIKTSRQSRFPQNRLLVEDLTAVGYPRPAPLLAASDHVFFEDRTAEPENRSTEVNLFPGPRISCISFRHSGMRPLAQAWNP